MPPQEMASASTKGEEEENVDDTTKRSLEIGKWLAHPPSGDEIVIAGMSGYFPESENMYQFRDNLYNKVDMITEITRWSLKHPEIPERGGCVPNYNKYDPGNFGMHHRAADTFDPMGRMLIERVVEAIFDAGINPKELEGSKTLVAISVINLIDQKLFYDNLQHQNFAIVGALKSTIANRISYALKLQGASINVDTACSSTLYAFDYAYNALRKGECDYAIVGGANFIHNPFATLQFARLGVLSMDGSSRPFDENASGYVRSEAVCAVLLQRAKNAKRIYSEVIHSKANCDGFKEQGITFPSYETQKRLFTEFYKECGVDGKELSFVEAHCTGTKVGDPAELFAVDEVFAQNRDKPLLVGSVKSNIGHTEPVAGLCSISKVLLGLENGAIPPNINFKNPRTDVEALKEGRMKVVAEKTPWPKKDNLLIGINGFGFGGANCHVLVRSFDKIKNSSKKIGNLPRLVCVSGRSEIAITSLLNEVVARKDVEMVALVNEVFKTDLEVHRNRGYTIFNENGQLKRSSSYLFKDNGPLHLAFGNITDWRRIANELWALPLFSSSINTINDILITKGVDLLKPAKNPDLQMDSTFEVLGKLAVQLALANVVKETKMNAAFVVGSPLCEAYISGLFLFEQAVFCAYYLSQVLGNSVSNGLPEKGKIFENHIKKELKNRKNLENGNNFHHWVENSAPLSQYLKEIIPNNKKVPLGVLSLSAENLLERLTRTSEGVNCVNLPFEATIFTIGNVNLKKTFKSLDGDIQIVQFGCDGEKLLLTDFLEALGRLYNLGYTTNLTRLYPKIEYPVKRGTGMISPFIKWNHDRDWYCPGYTPMEVIRRGTRSLEFAIVKEEYQYLMGHIIDGRNLFPAAGYLYLVWDTVAAAGDYLPMDMRVIFEDVKFVRAMTISKSFPIKLSIAISESNGYFEVHDNNGLVVSGRANMTLTPIKHKPLLNEQVSENPYKFTEKDIYKELKLRGYHYTGLFKSISEYDPISKRALIKWQDNWVAFLDNMLQLQILEYDSRLLFVPTSIERIVIDGVSHMEYVKEFEEETPLLPVTVCRETRTVRCGGIEIMGTNASSIAKRKPLGEPVLEKHLFVPNRATLTTEQAIRVNVQIALENEYKLKVKVVELIDEETRENDEPLSPLISDALGDLPLVKAEITVLSSKVGEVRDAVVEDKKLPTETGCFVVVASNIFSRIQILQQCLNAASEGYVISREPTTFNPSDHDLPEIQILTVYETETSEKLVFFRRSPKIATSIDISVPEDPSDLEWLPVLKQAVKHGDHVNLYAQNAKLNGIMGLYNCLHRETGGDKIKCVLILDETAPKFDSKDAFYVAHLAKNFAVNVYKNGEWGTYRHLKLEGVDERETEHFYSTVRVNGDLSSISWLEGEFSPDMDDVQDHILAHVYYAALNFRDVMIGTGKLSAEMITPDRLEQRCLQGFEYAGKTRSGKRIMGMAVKCISNLVMVDKNFLVPVPENWSLEEAATVMAVYGTVIYALRMRTSIKRGQSILIHSGTGGVGQSAIRVCQHFGLEIFVTVGTPEKKEYILKLFPRLKEENIGCSRNTSFEQMVLKRTKGRGVDYVLNSLADDKLLASIRCLAAGGHFLEIGKYDLWRNTPLELNVFRRNVSYHGIMLDGLFHAAPVEKQKVMHAILSGISDGYVKPLERKIFGRDEVEKAFRYMTTGAHTGKVLIRIREEEEDKNAVPVNLTANALPTYTCKGDESFIITGGLGGLGLELADWLVLRGAKYLVLNSRNGIKTGYQNSRVSLWRSYGIIVTISTADITNKDGCRQLIHEAKQLGKVTAVFNLAVVLKDGVFENQTRETFEESFGPKAVATKHLDEVTRECCPYLRDFVVFSSVSCGRGNPGQTNYGMANSIMERICEQRKRDGYPGLAIQWGAIGEVGLVAEMQTQHGQIEIGGTLQQKLSSCFEVLDQLLIQNEPVVSSMVVAEKRAFGSADNPVQYVANMLGVKDLKTVELHRSLAEMGMDSMMGVEIKQTLEREYDIFLTPQEVRGLTFGKLQDYWKSKEEETNAADKQTRKQDGLEFLIQNICDEQTFTKTVVELPTAADANAESPKVFLIPGVEGNCAVFQKLSEKIKARAFVMQYCGDKHGKTIDKIADSIFERMKEHLVPGENYNLVAFSLGCVIAVEVLHRLENAGHTGKAIFVDGAPEFMKRLFYSYKENVDHMLEYRVIFGLMSTFTKHEEVLKHKEAIYKCTTFEEMVDILVKNTDHAIFSAEYRKKLAIDFFAKIVLLMNYSNEDREKRKIKTTISLYRPTQVWVSDIEEDYALSNYTENKVKVTFLEGQHSNILDNDKLLEAIIAMLRGENETIEST